MVATNRRFPCKEIRRLPEKYTVSQNDVMVDIAGLEVLLRDG